MTRVALKITLLLVLVLGLRVVLAEEEGTQAVKKNVTIKAVSGEVSGISSNFIAILYGQDKKTSYEIGLAIDKETRVERKFSLKQIAVGDTVSVEYEETTQTIKEKTEKGQEKDVVRVLSRLAKVITFIREPAVGLRSSEEPQK